MADQTMDRIEKQLEGNSLALSAVAEVLSKMDGRLSRDEEVSLAKAEQEEAAADRSSLIKEIASEVAGILKGQDTDAGMDVDGEKVRPAAKTGKTPANADDAEKPVAATTKIEDQQATIQAMQKGGEDKEEDEKAEEYPVDEKKGGMKYKAEDDEEEDEEDVSKEGNGEAKEEDEEDVSKEGNGEAKEAEEEEEADAEKSLSKQLAALKKQVAEYEASMSKSIQVETESRLRKMGFREDNGLQRPMRTEVGLGVDGTSPIKKQAANADVADQLASLSYKELRDLQVNIENGKTEGVPRELLGAS